MAARTTNSPQTGLVAVWDQAKVPRRDRISDRIGVRDGIAVISDAVSVMP
ncbi:hypothetical protein MLAC_26990 [Mycobacterium lacus]|uniref:Uncharacterized protein n=1 Tax=Mycobacterium lacus TaxID=169765 RepID=A0A7I7NL64_9MYCO|nr:hypothetical protein MLAC_26990 [Mycobacterium lacus]